MGAFFVYILKSAVCLSLFYLFYRLLLSRETFHRFNRIAVLSLLLFSLLIPFCEVRIAEQTEVNQTVLSLEQLLLLVDGIEGASVVEAEQSRPLWVYAALCIYLLGVVFFIGRNLYALVRMILLLKSGRREELAEGITLIVHDRSELAPFSWMRYVVISHKDLTENGREILIHELAHVRRHHSVDLLIADCCIFFQWFNPAAWLLKQELQNIHEYEADETVIGEGVDAKHYQLLLIKKAVGTRLYSMANSFNHSKLKKRITMMLKEKSSPWARLKYLYVLPLAAVAVTAFARPETSTELEEISKIKVNDLAAITTTTEGKSDSALPGDTVPVIKLNNSVVVVGYDSLSIKPSRAMIISVDKDSANAQKVVQVFNDDMSVKKKIKIDMSSDAKNPICIIDGEEVEYSLLKTINPKEIESISVLKDKMAVEQYGDKAVNGVIVVTLKKAETEKE